MAYKYKDDKHNGHFNDACYAYDEEGVECECKCKLDDHAYHVMFCLNCSDCNSWKCSQCGGSLPWI